jgi:hypothetical protein
MKKGAANVIENKNHEYSIRSTSPVCRTDMMYAFCLTYIILSYPHLHNQVVCAVLRRSDLKEAKRCKSHAFCVSRLPLGQTKCIFVSCPGQI